MVASKNHLIMNQTPFVLLGPKFWIQAQLVASSVLKIDQFDYQILSSHKSIHQHTPDLNRTPELS